MYSTVICKYVIFHLIFTLDLDITYFDKNETLYLGSTSVVKM